MTSHILCLHALCRANLFCTLSRICSKGLTRQTRSLCTCSNLQPHQSVLLLAADQLVMEVHVAEVLRNGEAAQAVTRVVEISGSEHMTT